MTMQNVPISELMQLDLEWTRGHAHHRFDTGAGRIELGPLRLFALQDIDAGHGYSMHAHANVEVITLVLDGAVLHRDSLGVEQRMPAETVATMSAGRGLQHAEHADADGPARVIQIWLQPSVLDTPPATAHARMPRVERRDRFRVLVSGRSRDASDAALSVRQDAALLAAVLSAGNAVDYRIDPGRCAYLVPLHAAIRVNGERAAAGERLLVRTAAALRIWAERETEVLLLDMPA